MVVLSLLVAGCKGEPEYDRSSPEATLESFFTALNNKRLPKDLPIFLGEQELKIWNMRCKQPGCAGGNYKVVTRGDGNDVRATLYIDYAIEAANGVQIMKGDKSPVAFEKEGKTWTIMSFGRQIHVAPKPPPNPQPEPASSDAGTIGK